MSRTFRRRKDKHAAREHALGWFNTHEDSEWWLNYTRMRNPGLTDEQILKKYERKFHKDECPGTRNAPKWFRQELNQQYRARTNHALRNLIASNDDDYDLVEIPFKKTANWEWW